MILIADSGSTKTDWCIVFNGTLIKRIGTKGINPFFQSEEEIQQELTANIRLDFNQYDDKIEYVFYCEAQFRIHMFGRAFPPVTQRIELTGSHHTKY